MSSYNGIYKIIIIGNENFGVLDLLDFQTEEIFSPSVTKREVMRLYFVIKRMVSKVSIKEKVISDVRKIFELVKQKYRNYYTEIKFIPYQDYTLRFVFSILLEPNLPPLEFLFQKVGDDFACRTVFSATTAVDPVKTHLTVISLIDEFKKKQFYIDVNDSTGYYDSRNFNLLSDKKKEVGILGFRAYKKLVSIKHDDYMLQIWYLSNEERFKYLLPNYLKGSNGAIIIFSFADRTSFSNALNSIQIVQSQCGNYIPIMLLGKKHELSQTKLIADWEIKDLIKRNAKQVIYRERPLNDEDDLNLIFMELLQTILIKFN
jgi:GTPase SAR1 family protein